MSNEDTLKALGKLIPDASYGKDAVHIAVIPAIAANRLDPGEHVEYRNGTAHSRRGASMPNTNIGIVDPYLATEVKPGQRFWLFLYPGTITSLRHEWTHPAIDQDDDVAAFIHSDSGKKVSQDWMENFAGQYGFRASRMLSQAEEWIDHGEYFCDGGTFEGEWVPDEFWDHFQKLTGRSVPPTKRESFFTCSC